MKIKKEVKAGLIAILAIGLLVTGINFLKGYSFFGGDAKYTAYFPNAGGLGASTSVYLNGVVIGKIISVDYNPSGDSLSKVKMVFTVQEDGLKIPKSSVVETGSVDLLNKGLFLFMGDDLSKGYYKEGEAIQGRVQLDMFGQLKSYANPVMQKVSALVVNVDKTITSLKGFWDTTATSELKTSLEELKYAFKKFGNIADDVEGLVATEKVKLSRIMSNVESITGNLKASNEKISKIVGNFEKVSDDLVTADFKKVINNANTTIEKLNATFAEIESGKGTLGKLLKDEKLYNELVVTNKSLQNLVNDIELHPERYIHFSVFGAKTKGVPITGNEEKKLRNLLDSIPD
ncbi:MlaD family protein [Fluviicola taffensis]|uniref:Mammalian cell entry related domain protein n=1 Tax=Fluviicola taffensis (strain DSM 16823 / NCIMB 13979 / RW262) TaxID=755732 RepID=F2IBN3_FLUTR|nr:MlaD family protein [Fluviicola taffensis]AEA45359.1 Mammalian cell entry related domain protein [Fluviicola taffensis DSM 16823]